MLVPNAGGDVRIIIMDEVFNGRNFGSSQQKNVGDMHPFGRTFNDTRSC